MPEVVRQYEEEIIRALLQTFMMVGASIVAAVLVGISLFIQG